jgi:hypothetical protein
MAGPDKLNPSKVALKAALTELMDKHNKEKFDKALEANRKKRLQDEQNKIQPALSPSVLKRAAERKEKLAKLVEKLKHKCDSMTSDGLRAYEEYATTMGDVLALTRLLARVLNKKYNLNATDATIAAVNILLDGKEGVEALYRELKDYQDAVSKGNAELPGFDEKVVDVMDMAVGTGGNIPLTPLSPEGSKLPTDFHEPMREAIKILLEDAGYSKDGNGCWTYQEEGTHATPSTLNDDRLREIIGEDTTVGKLFDRAVKVSRELLPENLHKFQARASHESHEEGFEMVTTNVSGPSS